MTNSLTVFNSEVIPVYTTDTGERVVIGRELHEKLGIGTDYKDWFPRMCEYGFSEPADYAEFDEEVAAQNRARTYRQKNHLLKLEMAKHIAMIQRTARGKAIRDKLIALETNLSELSPELRALIGIEVRQKQQERALAETNRRLDNIGAILALSPTQWRGEAARLVTKIARKLGGVEHIRDVYEELYRLVDERSGSAMGIRLANLKRRQLENGVCRSKVDKLGKLDVIGEDKKLKEIFVAVVKEMAIKYHIDL